MPGYPLVPLIYVGAGTMMLILSYLERPMESSLAICTVLAGIPVFLWFRRKKADYRQSGRPSDV
jgi:APA family basic amino acid/polyamine antiporter